LEIVNCGQVLKKKISNIFWLLFHTEKVTY
jgi:hypothetical protein